MRNKPDDRSDNAAKIAKNIEATRDNMEAAEEMIARTSDPKERQKMHEKNERRKQALPQMEKEMIEEKANNELGNNN